MPESGQPGKPKGSIATAAASIRGSTYRISQLLDKMRPDYDRGLALYFQSILEEAIRQSLAEMFTQTGGESKRLIGGGATGGSIQFMDQCRLAFCLGIIGENTLQELSRMAKIRNLFGHSHRKLEFSDPEVADRCVLLTSPIKLQSHVTDAMLEEHGFTSYQKTPAKEHADDLFAATAILLTDRLTHEVVRKKQNWNSQPTWLD